MTLTAFKRNAQSVFNDWAKDYHAEGMENGHWPAVQKIFQALPDSTGHYLEIGVGNGYGITHLAQHQFKNGQCFGLDISEEMAALTAGRTAALGNVSIESGDFLTWQPPQNLRFDTIFSMEVFYYFPSIQKGINKAVSHLEQGGRLLLAVNFYQENTASHTWPQELDTPMQLWSADAYKSGFETAGLEGVQQQYITVKPNEVGTLLTIGTKP